MATLLVHFILLAIALIAIFGWKFVERHTFSEFFVAQVVGEQKTRVPGFKQYTFVCWNCPIWMTPAFYIFQLFFISIGNHILKGSTKKEELLWRNIRLASPRRVTLGWI